MPPPPPPPQPVEQKKVEAPPPPAPTVKEPDIAQEREKKKKQELAKKRAQELDLQKKQELEREKKLEARKKLEQEKREQLAAQKAAQKAAEDRNKQEELAKAAKEKAKQLADAKRREALREENLKRMQGLAGATGGSTSTGTALRSAGPSDSYAGRIRARVKPNIVFTEEITGNPELGIEEVGPWQFYGIEVKRWAREIAELTLWIGFHQFWMEHHKGVNPPEPVLQDTGTLEWRDAVLECDEIVEIPGRSRPDPTPRRVPGGAASTPRSLSASSSPITAPLTSSDEPP